MTEFGVCRALQLRDGATGAAAAARAERSEKLREITYDEVLEDYAVYGTPEAVADRLLALREELGLTTISAWMNAGSLIPHDRIVTSMRVFAERVISRLN